MKRGHKNGRMEMAIAKRFEKAYLKAMVPNPGLSNIDCLLLYISSPKPESVE